MPQTMTEKILARAARQASVSPDQEITARPDFVITYDFPGYVAARDMWPSLGARCCSPKRFSLASST